MLNNYTVSGDRGCWVSQGFLHFAGVGGFENNGVYSDTLGKLLQRSWSILMSNRYV